jgi:Fibronectin type III domain
VRSTHVGALRPLCAALGGVALMVVITLLPSLEATGASMSAGAGLSTNYDFARLVLQDGGWPTSPNNVTVVTQWLRAEEPASDWWDRDNPLNNGLGSGGGSGLGSYDSLVTAAHDVAQNLENSGWGYPLVVTDLAHSMAPAVTVRAIWRSSWAAGHYGFGADWDTSPVPSVTAPPIAWRDPSSCTPSAPSVVTTCGAAFSVRGAAWHWAPLAGFAGDELWAFASRGTSHGAATWRPKLSAGTYEVEALVPAQFADATASYVVVDADRGHRVVVNQEPYSNTWVPLGEYTADARSPISVVLPTSTSGTASGTYLAASDMRFVPVAGTRALAREGSLRVQTLDRPPGAPQDVAAVAANRSAVVSWLAPSKDGGDAILGYEVTALPGDRTCRTGDSRPASPTCTVGGLTNGRAYQFVVRAVTAAGTSGDSIASAPTVPLRSTTVKVRTVGTPTYGGVVVFRAFLNPAPANGLVLFAEDGRVVPGCGSATVVKGRASCAVRLTTVGAHQLLVTFSGSASSTGAEAETTVVVRRAATAMRATVDPVSSPALAIVAVYASELPGEATGEVVFTSGAVRLCASAVKSGGGSCRFRLRLSPGVHQVVATYLGSRDFLRSAARTSLRVLAPQGP